MDSSLIYFETKGDANNVKDGSLVHYKHVVCTQQSTYFGYKKMC